MGYSISVDCRSAKLRDQMLSLMDAEFKHWDEVIGFELAVEQGGDLYKHKPEEVEEFGEIARFISRPTASLDYSSRKWSIGFNYGAWHGAPFERFYYWTVLRWMALKVGRRKSKLRFEGEKMTKFPEPLPYTLYDGWDEWPLFLEKPDDKLWCWVNELGMQQDEMVLCGRVGDAFWPELRDFHKDKPFHEAFTWKPEVVPHLKEDLDLIEQKKHLVRTLFWDQLVERLVPVREELQRLDDFWCKS